MWSPSSWSLAWWYWNTLTALWEAFIHCRMKFVVYLLLPLSFFFFFFFTTDCESHCKASKGKMKITMKKYCKKDYGEWVQPAGMCAARHQPAVKRSDVSINQMPSAAGPHPGCRSPIFQWQFTDTVSEVMSTNTDLIWNHRFSLFENRGS